jgi:hypothetical protein
VSAAEAEAVVLRERPVKVGEGKRKAIGRGVGGRFLQVVCVFDHDGTVYVLHARPLTDSEKHRVRRSER